MGDEMLDQVEAAIATVYFDDEQDDVKLVAEMAHAAISALRGPTEAMMRAMLEASSNDPQTLDIWQAGIEAALGET